MTVTSSTKVVLAFRLEGEAKWERQTSGDVRLLGRKKKPETFPSPFRTWTDRILPSEEDDTARPFWVGF